MSHSKRSTSQMNEKNSLKDVFQFDEEGTLPPPGPIGRLVRLALGLVIAKFIYDWFAYIDISDFDNPFILIWIVFSIALVPYVVNIGWGVNFGAKPRYVLICIWALGAGAGYLVEGSMRSQLLWTVVEVTQIYIYGHLGISFFLSAIIATPGCEMRAIPHLLGKVSGAGSKEHYCPGFIDNIDRWELNRGRSSSSDG